MPFEPPDAASAYLRAAFALGANVAVSVRAWLIVTVHAKAPVHTPVQPLNLEPVAGVAVNVIFVP